MDLDYVSIHGRFQPFHNGHLAYAEEALRQSKRVYIGLTKVLTEAGPGGRVAPHRADPAANPLSYFERVQVIRSALAGAGYPANRFEIGPFPIENPARLPEFWPTSLVCMTTLVDRWNEEKVKILREQGYVVHILKEGAYVGESYASGTKIRELIRDNDLRWKSYVPAASIAIIENTLT